MLPSFRVTRSSSSSISPAEYVHQVAHDDNEEEVVRALASKTWRAMKRTAKAGQRRTLPDMHELDALLKDNKQTTVGGQGRVAWAVEAESRCASATEEGWSEKTP